MGKKESGYWDFARGWLGRDTDGRPTLSEISGGARACGIEFGGCLALREAGNTLPISPLSPVVLPPTPPAITA